MSLMSSDEVSLLNDGRYKNFIGNLERVLKQFEYSSEWADLITNLVKVKKVSSIFLFTFMNFKYSFIYLFIIDNRKLSEIYINTKTYNIIKTTRPMSSSCITIWCSFKNP